VGQQAGVAGVRGRGGGGWQSPAEGWKGFVGEGSGGRGGGKGGGWGGGGGGGGGRVAEPQPPEGPGLSKPQGKGQTPRLSREAKGIIRPSNPQGNSDRAPWAAEAPPKGGKGLWVRGRGGGGVRRGCHSAVAELPLATDGDFFSRSQMQGLRFSR